MRICLTMLVFVCACMHVFIFPQVLPSCLHPLREEKSPSIQSHHHPKHLGVEGAVRAEVGWRRDGVARRSGPAGARMLGMLRPGWMGYGIRVKGSVICCLGHLGDWWLR